MENLSRKLVASGVQFNDDLKMNVDRDLPEKVLQFGEGNFLRGFVDWMIHELNRQELFEGKVVIVQPLSSGMVDMINKQDGLYTLFLRGIQNGEIVRNKSLISSVSRGINPYTEFDEYLKCAENPELRVIISNTTEAGIAYNPDDRFQDSPPASYPGKLTVFLYKRFKTFKGDPAKGFIIMPCELIDRNGDNLKRIVLQLAEEWRLGSNFISWLNSSNHFLNTLVDRIVTGFPRDEYESLSEELGYHDHVLDTAEIFHLWVIEGDKKLAQELPFTEAGLNVIWTEDMAPYRTRKVRILNGAHTMTVMTAYLYGKETVKECMDDPVISLYMNKGIFEEIIPTLALPENELKEFATAVAERFANPFIKHYLLSITLNSTSKFKTRVLPSILEYVAKNGKLPKVLTFSMAALLAFYRGTEIRENALIGNRLGNEYEIKDELPVLEMFKSLWAQYDGSREGARKLVQFVLSRAEIWGTDLNNVQGFSSTVTSYLYNIITKGVNEAIKEAI